MDEPGEMTLSSKDVMRVLCESLRELRDTQGVTAAQVRHYMRQRYTGETAAGQLSDRRLRLELRRAVQEGFLVSSGGRYNLSDIMSTPTKVEKRTNVDTPNESGVSSGLPIRSKSSETDPCGCPKKRKASSSCKRRSKSRKSGGKMVCKMVCKKVERKKSSGLIKRLIKLLRGKKGGCKKMKEKKKRFSWVKAHCRKNALRRKKSKCKRSSSRGSSHISS